MREPPPLPALLVAAALSLAAGIAGSAAREAAPGATAAEPDAPREAPDLAADPLRPGRPAPRPYLAPDALNPVLFLPPPPAPGSAQEAADRAAFAGTRALAGGPRWRLATEDVAEGAAAALDGLACVLGARIDPGRVPALIDLLDRARLDLARAARLPKVHYRRARPFVGDDAPICVARTPELARSYSYPSGHATQGWAYALIAAALVPAKAAAILARGRAYGDSRIVCGVHWASDVAAGRVNGAAVFAALVGDPGFRADLERARAELRAALAAGGDRPDPAACAREAEALREPAADL